MGAGALLLLLLASTAVCEARYWGQSLGPLSQLQHGVQGTVHAVDARTLYIRNLHYDGQGPAAYFYVGTTNAPSSGGTRLRDERGRDAPLRSYRGEGVTLSLPEGKTLKDYKYLSIWCDEYSVNFGHVSIPHDVEFPKPARLGALRGVHGVSSDPIVVVDAQTILLPNFSYDGEAPDAKFWVGRGEKPSPQGVRIPDENGKEAPLRKYDRKTIVLTLPGELTVFDIGHFGVWCEAFTVDFGHVALPRSLIANVPPSLKMLGVSPQSKLNCEVLLDELAFEVRWAVAGDSIVLQLVAKLEDGEYMSFGVSGSPTSSVMVGGDVAVAWVDKATLKGYAQDYYLDAKSQCAGVRGSCPDERLGEKTNSIRLLNAALVNGYSIVTYQRPLKAADELDRAVLTNASQPVIWALGPLNSRQEVSYHHHFTKGDKLIEFGRPPVWNCPMPEGEEDIPTTQAPPRTRKPVQEQTTTQVAIKPNRVPTPAPAPKAEPWDIPPIQCYEPPDGVFYAQMGPTGGKQGYPAITGHVGWGVSWYINGLLIPELTLVRGRRYTFVVEGGSDPNTPAKYHPFYITNDHIGGYFHKTDEEKKGVEIYAGVRRTRSGEVVPTGVGRLCSWTADPDAAADEFPSFGAYQRALTLVCEEGSPGVVTWTPDRNTPDNVYYQCFTHRHLGWKIHIVDECDEGEAAAESRVQPVAVAPPDDLIQEESEQVETRTQNKPNQLEQRKSPKIINTKNNYNDFSSHKSGEIYKEEELPVSVEQIYDVIDAVEGLEAKMRSPRPAHPYQVHDSPDASSDQPARDNEYSSSPINRDHYFLPADQKPLTLQSVLKPNTQNAQKHPNSRPSFRRPIPPEMNFRRPPPPQMHHKNNYPLPMPMPGPGGYNQPKKPYGKPYRPMNRPSMNPHNMNNMNIRSIPPMKAMPPLHHQKNAFHQGPNHLPKFPTNPVPTLILGKPPAPANLPVQIVPTQSHQIVPTQSQTLNVGRTDLIANQIVKSQITLPGVDSVASSSIQSYVNQPGQIILGKPMDHPVPLDQQMIPTRHHLNTQASTEPIYNNNDEKEQKSESNLKSSDFIGEHVETSSLPPAVNTGFKPNTIVIESGFKPIIREPLMDRLGGDYDTNSNRREDTDVLEDYEDSPQHISNHVFQVPSDKLTEGFEPMFIPSPLDTMQASDMIIPTGDRTKEVFPSNHAKEDRPHPVYVKSDTELNALFSKTNTGKDITSDLVMESDKISPQYLPPDPNVKLQSQKPTLNEQTFVTYDGKIVSATSLTSVPDANIPLPPKIFSSKLPANTELLLKTPQFGPFKGEIPSLQTEPIAHDEKTTRLKLINAFKEDEEDKLKVEATETHEVQSKSDYKIKNDGPKNNDTKNNEIDKTEDKVSALDDLSDEGDDDEYEEDEDIAMEEQQRYKRDTNSHQPTIHDNRHDHNHVYIDRVSSKSSKLHWSNFNLIFLTFCLKFF